MFRATARLHRAAGLLASQTAIITGSGQGIGAECAKLFASEGAKVVVCDVDKDKASEVVNQINSLTPNQAISVVGDVTDKSYVTNLIKQAADFGEGKIHQLVNNAGFTWDGTIHKMTDEQWDAILAVHSTSVFRMIREVAPFFRINDGQQRSIVNVSSTSGTHGLFGQANYAAAKASVIGLTKTIAREWGPKFGVRANTVAFGRIDTRLTRAKENGDFIFTPDGHRVPLGIPKTNVPGEEMFKDIPLGRPGTALEGAKAILAVSSPLFSYVTGQTIEVTGGRNI